MTGFWRAEAAALLVRVKVQPKSRRPGLEGLRPALDGPRLRVSVTEAPEDGRANQAVCAALAKALGLPAAAVEIAQGPAARDKTMRVWGHPALLIPKLEGLA